MAVDFATPDDVEALWRPLTQVELAVAQARLTVASAVVRQRFRTIDQRVASGELSVDVVRGVVVDMVKRVLQAPDGVRSRSQTVGPFSESVTYGDEQNRLGLYLTGEELALLAPSLSGKAPARSIRMRVGW